MLSCGTFTLLGAATAVSVIDAVGPASLYEQYGLSGILILALVALYTDSKRRQDKFEKLLADTVVLLTQVRDTITKCARDK